MNLLAHEKSPYLLQHKDNPVDWYPWGAAAFEKARREDKPIFLSIGYSTCHWCHVMEHESFENEAVAKILNDHYVSIKVDREERPDIDQVYMKAAMTLTGQGGWPLSAFLTPDLQPFYAGTYFPPDDRWGRPGFISVLTQLNQKWKGERELILNAGKELTRILNESAIPENPEAEINLEKWLSRAAEKLAHKFDAEYGGFGNAPKFPRTHVLDLLLKIGRKPEQKEHVMGLVEATLRPMAAGGIHDHLGGGFHRYSVDALWMVPHFEKMLYDQALIAWTYLESFRLTGNTADAGTAKSIFNYALRDLRSPEGAFYSAEDADSLAPDGIKKEGAFYVWEEREVRELLTPEEYEVFSKNYELRPVSPEQDPHGEMKGKSILMRLQNHALPVPGLLNILDKLFQYRAKRPRPHRDEKILLDWNALMIEALARAGRVLNDSQWTVAAEKAFAFLRVVLKRPDGRWQHRYAAGEAVIPAFLEDYAFLARASLELYQATFKTEYLQEAHFLAGELMRLFYDSKDGGFFLSAADGENLITRTKEIYDGAIPSGNGAAIQILIKLGNLFGRTEWLQAAEKTVRCFYPYLQHDPSAFPLTLLGLAAREEGEVFLAGDPGESEMQSMLALTQQFPGVIWIFKNQNGDWLDQVLPAARERTAKEGLATAYFCQNQACQPPVHRVEGLREKLATGA